MPGIAIPRRLRLSTHRPAGTCTYRLAFDDEVIVRRVPSVNSIVLSRIHDSALAIDGRSESRFILGHDPVQYVARTPIPGDLSQPGRHLSGIELVEQRFRR